MSVQMQNDNDNDNDNDKDTQDISLVDIKYDVLQESIPNYEEDEEQLWSPLQKRLLGIAIIVGIVASWVSSAEFANYSGQTMNYNKYFFLVYLLDAWNILIFPLFCLFSWLFKLLKHGRCENPLRTLQEDMRKDKMGAGKIMLTALVSTFNQVVADYGYFRALSITSTSSGIVLFNLSSVFAYILSIFILGERFSVIKAACVLLAFGGAAAITFSDQSDNVPPPGAPDPWIGDVIMGGAALFWALYLVCYKKFVGDPRFGTINIQGTLMGVFNIFLLWPIILLLHYTHVETFELPQGETLKLVLITTVLVFINNYLFTFGTAVTSPVFVTIGGMLAIPGSVIVDWLFRDGHMTVWKIVGSGFMAIAFLLINLELDNVVNYMKEKCCGSFEYSRVEIEIDG